MKLRHVALLLALSAFAAPPAQAQQSPGQEPMGCGESVTIQSGDTLGAIAARCGTTVGAIQQANPGLGDPRRLQIGTEIRLPERSALGEGAAPSVPTTSAPRTDGITAGTSAESYVIRQGDTWDSIAQRLGSNVDSLMKANPDIASVSLNVGSQLKVPEPRESVAGLPDTDGSVIDTDHIRVVGRLTGEGVECPALRSADDTLYTLAGDISGFSEGDQVVVTGTKAEMSTCMQGTTIAVNTIAPAP